MAATGRGGGGITNALRDAELLTEAIVAGLGRLLAAARAGHQRRRDAAIRPM